MLRTVSARNSAGAWPSVTARCRASASRVLVRQLRAKLMKNCRSPLDGVSGDRQFFISFARSWRTKTREALARQRAVTDGHAPAEFRADTVRNMDAWYAAFDVKPGDRLYLPPAERVR